MPFSSWKKYQTDPVFEAGAKYRDRKKKIILLLLIFSNISLFGEQSSRIMILRSSAFYDGSAIPKLFTCKGENISPPFSWEKNRTELSLLL